MKAFFVKLFDRLLCTALALTLVQFPLYFDQYLTTLAGAHGEARHLYQDIQARAKKMNLSIKVFIDQHLEADNALFRQTGEALDTVVKRYHRHEAALEALNGAEIWKRPILFAAHYDGSIRSATRFSPGLPLTLEALAYAILGVLLGLGFMQLVKRTLIAILNLAKRPFSRRGSVG